MIDKKFVENLKKEYAERESERRQIGALSNAVLHDSKRLIFSLHRGEIKEVGERFKEVEKVLTKIQKDFGLGRAYEEGSFKAAMEEYAEAKLLYMVLKDKKIEPFKEIKLNHETYLGGICDLMGELVRYATNEAAKGKFEVVKEIKESMNEIMARLVDFDMTGYLRTKYDQARGHLRKVEQMDYEIRLRKE